MKPLAVLNAEDRAAWAAVLQPGERVFWHGRPTGVALARSKIRISLGGILFLTPASLIAPWFLAPLARGDYGLVSVSAALTTIICLASSVPYVLAAPWALIGARWVCYMVTDRRAMILTTSPIRRLRSFAPGDLNAVERRGAGVLLFHKWQNLDGFDVKVGFHGLTDADAAEAAILTLRGRAGGKA